jgi:hypothetical protein
MNIQNQNSASVIVMGVHGICFFSWRETSKEKSITTPMVSATGLFDRVQEIRCGFIKAEPVPDQDSDHGLFQDERYAAVDGDQQSNVSESHSVDRSAVTMKVGNGR